MSQETDNSAAEAEAAAAAAAEHAAAVARGDVIEDDTQIEKTPDELAAEAAAEAAKKGEKTADELANEDDVETEAEKAEREAEEAAAAAEAANKKRVRIPLERHEAVVAKARQREEALQAQLQQALQASRQQAPPQRNALAEMKNKIDELQDKYEELVFDGKKDEAKKIRVELDQVREVYIDTKTATVGDQARRQTIDDLKYETTLAKAEADYPALNPDSPDTFESAKADEVAALLGMFTKNGLTRQAALERAVRYVMGEPVKQAAAKNDNAADVVAQRRAEEARKKAVEVQKRQPPDGSVIGTDNDKAGKRSQGGIDVTKLSQDQFAKLDEATLSKMRGDTL